MAVTGAQTARPAAGPAAAGFRRWLMRHPGVARAGIVILLVVVWEIAARFFSTGISSARLRRY